MVVDIKKIYLENNSDLFNKQSKVTWSTKACDILYILL